MVTSSPPASRSAHFVAKGLLPYLTAGTAVVTLLLSGSILAEWAMRSLWVARIQPEYIPMAPATAGCLLVLSMAIVVRQWRPARPELHHLQRMLAGLGLIFCSVLLAQFILVSMTGAALDLEQWLVAAATSEHGYAVGRMSPATALLLMALSSALLLSHPNQAASRLQHGVAQSLALTIGFSGGIMLVGYGYGTPLLYGGPITPIAFPTALSLFLLGSGMLVENQHAWLAAWLTSNSVAGHFTRRVLPGTIGVFLILGWIHLTFLENLSQAYETFFFSLNTLATVGLITLLTTVAARQVQATVTHAEQALRENEMIFAAFLEHSPVYVFFKDNAARSLRLSRNYEQLLGQPIPNLLGKTMAELFPSELAHRMVADDLRILNRGELISVEEELKGRIYETTKFPIFKEGQPYLLAGFTVDITERKLAEAAVRESEARYRRLVEGAPDVVYTFSSKRGGIYYSPRVQQVLGYSVEHLYAHPFFWNESIHPDDQGRIREVVSKFEVGKSFEVEYRIRDAQGRWRWLHDRSIGRQMGEGGEEEVLIEGIATDITERKQAEDALRVSEARFRAVAETATDAIITVDQHGAIAHWNSAAEKMFGYAANEVLGQPVALIMPAHYRRQHDRMLQQAVATGQLKISGAPRELIGRAYDGHEFPIELSLAQWQTQSQLFFTAIVRDITHRKHLETTLRDSEHKHRTLLDHIPQRIFYKDRASVYIALNRACAEDYGCRPEDIVGKTDAAFFSPALAQAHYVSEQRVMAQGIMEEQDEPYSAHGKNLMVHSIKAPIRDETNAVVGLMGIFWDVTERLRVEAEIREARDKLEVTAQRMQALAQRLVEVQEAERRELSRELHDRIGQNLTGLNINLSLIQSQLPPETTAPVQQRLKDSTKLVEETIERIRDVMGELRPAVLDDYGLPAALRWHIERLEAQTGLVSQIVLKGHPATRLPAPVESALFRIAQEALHNVVKHAQAQHVTITLDLHPVRLVIRDDGRGVDTLSGSGWGLSIMNERAESIGARFEISSSPGGTSVTVEVNP